MTIGLRKCNRVHFIQMQPDSCGIVAVLAAAETMPQTIDEFGSLPYKPRQLSAMARFCRVRLYWAGTGRMGSASSDLNSNT